MNLLLNYFLCFYLIFSTSATRQPIRIETKTGFIDIIPKNETQTTTSTTTIATVSTLQKINEKEIKSLLIKMLTLAAGADKRTYTTKNTASTTTETIATTAAGVKTNIRNRPQQYSGVNGTINRLCPYFVPGNNFKMEKLSGVYWPRFYNMDETLRCFKIDVTKLSEKQMKDNEWTFGTFGGKMDWRESHFEIKPPRTMSKRRHFLLGGPDGMGVMRNIMITKDSNDEFILQEESPDQWLMVRNVVVLRDCMTGEVVVFTKSPQQTSTAEVVEVLQTLGEQLTGQMVCDDDDDWLRDYYV